MKRHRQIKTILLAGLATLLSQAAQAESLTVVVTGIEEIKGEIRMALYNSAEAFNQGGAATRGGYQAVSGEVATITLGDLAAGEYAIRLYQDIDSDGQLTANMMGMPAEPYGFSGRSTRRGPPLWDEAVFEVVEGSANETVVVLR